MIHEIIAELRSNGFIVVSRSDGKVERHTVSDNVNYIIALLKELAKTREKAWLFSTYPLSVEDFVKEENIEIVYLMRMNSDAYKTLQYDDNGEIVYLPENPDEIVYDNVSIGVIMEELGCTNLSYELWKHGCKYLAEMCEGVTLNRFLDIVAETADEYHKPSVKPKNWNTYTMTGNPILYPEWTNITETILVPPVTQTELDTMLQEAENRAVEEIDYTLYRAIEDTLATEVIPPQDIEDARDAILNEELF